MGFFHYGCPPYLAAWASTVLPDATAVETGTFQGDSAAELADAFGRCITIERQPALAAAALSQAPPSPCPAMDQGIEASRKRPAGTPRLR